MRFCRMLWPTFTGSDQTQLFSHLLSCSLVSNRLFQKNVQFQKKLKKSKKPINYALLQVGMINSYGRKQTFFRVMLSDSHAAEGIFQKNALFDKKTRIFLEERFLDRKLLQGVEHSAFASEFLPYYSIESGARSNSPLSCGRILLFRPSHRAAKKKKE